MLHHPLLGSRPGVDRLLPSGGEGLFAGSVRSLHDSRHHPGAACMAVVTLTVREAIKRAGAAYERGQLDQAALISNLDGLAAAGLSGADAAPGWDAAGGATRRRSEVRCCDRTAKGNPAIRRLRTGQRRSSYVSTSATRVSSLSPSGLPLEAPQSFSISTSAARR
jgi:hypothetical protein